MPKDTSWFVPTDEEGREGNVAQAAGDCRSCRPATHEPMMTKTADQLIIHHKAESSILDRQRSLLERESASLRIHKAALRAEPGTLFPKTSPEKEA